jgi:hypothetical protein
MSPDVAESGGHGAGLVSPQPGVLLLLSLPILLCTVASCSSILPHRGEQAEKVEENPVPKAVISETEAAIYECVLRHEHAQEEFSTDSIHMLTFTDHPDWCDRSTWLNPSRVFLERVADLNVDIRRPCDLYYDGGPVYRDRTTKREAVLHWASIDKWIDADTAEVKVGHWRGNLLAHGRKLLLVKRGGKWEVDPESYGNFWNS